MGIGSDLVDMRRIEKTVERYGNRFINRVFTETEQAQAMRRVNPIPTYAKRFAAKEALVKALGTGFRKGIFFKDIGVVNHPSGQPALVLTGGALERLNSLTPKDNKAVLHLTITDEAPYAQAFVIIVAESVKKE